MPSATRRPWLRAQLLLRLRLLRVRLVAAVMQPAVPPQRDVSTCEWGTKTLTHRFLQRALCTLDLDVLLQAQALELNAGLRHALRLALHQRAAQT
jgi:hypothetical protein